MLNGQLWWVESLPLATGHITRVSNATQQLAKYSAHLQRGKSLELSKCVSDRRYVMASVARWVELTVMDLVWRKHQESYK